MKKSILFLCLALFSFIIFGGNVFAADPHSVTIDGIKFNGVYFDDPDMKYVIYEDTAGDYRAILVGSFRGNAAEDTIKFISSNNGADISLHANYYCEYQNFIKVTSSSGSEYYSPVQANYVGSLQANNSRLMNSAVVKFIATNDKVVLQNGDLVFPEPPASNPTLEEILEGAQVVGTKTTTTMKTLTIVAVSLLALLIGLHLLPKVLYRFLAR